MNIEQAIRILKPLMWKIGKSDGEQLWVHQFTVWYLLKQLMGIGAFPSLDDERREILEVACLLHDLKKSTPWNQLILSGNPDTEKIISEYKKYWHQKGVEIKDKELIGVKRLFESGRTNHQIETDRDFEYFLKPYLDFVKGELPFAPSEDKTRMLFDIMKHHFLAEEDISSATLPGFGNYLYMLKICDRLASMKTIDVRLINELRKLNQLGRQMFDITYFTVSRNYNPSTALIINVATKAYKDNGWIPLLYLEEGGIFVANGKGKIPEKEKIVKNVASLLSQKTLELASTKTGRKSILTGIAKDHPMSFVLSQRDNLIRELDRETAGSEFLKVFIEILISGKMRKPKIREKNQILDILFGIHPGTRGITDACMKWEKLFNEKLPKKGDGKFDKTSTLNHIFNAIKLEDILTGSLSNKITPSKNRLNDFSSIELFQILQDMASIFDKESEKDKKIKNYVDDIISIEEDKNFREIAKDRFDRYRSFKKNPPKMQFSLCETCGCPIAQKRGPDFPKGQIKAFTQTKADPKVEISICPFCAYDNSVMRQGLRDNIPIYLKIHSRVPLSPYRRELKEQIKLLRDGLIRIQEIENMQERWGILFPDVDIVIGDSNYDISSFEDMETEQETVFRLESVRADEFSPKDQKVKYEPLYHLLRLLGFQVSIGREEQIGLFGGNHLTTKQVYYSSLSAVLLSSTLGDKSKRYIIARDLLEKSPSVAISHCASEDKDRQGNRWLRLREGVAKQFFKYLAESDIKIFKNGGDYTMKDLLQHAAFFADKEKGIGHFCIEPEKRGEFWNPTTMTRYSTSKPVGDALDEIMQGREMDLVMERFMRNLAKKIGQEEHGDLANFVKGAKEIFLKYYDLRKQDISKFIRAKNALTSAIYVFTRYEKLKIKEVIEP